MDSRVNRKSQSTGFLNWFFIFATIFMEKSFAILGLNHYLADDFFWLKQNHHKVQHFFFSILNGLNWSEKEHIYVFSFYMCRGNCIRTSNIYRHSTPNSVRKPVDKRDQNRRVILVTFGSQDEFCYDNNFS